MPLSLMMRMRTSTCQGSQSNRKWQPMAETLTNSILEVSLWTQPVPFQVPPGKARLKLEIRFEERLFLRSLRYGHWNTYFPPSIFHKQSLGSGQFVWSSQNFVRRKEAQIGPLSDGYFSMLENLSLGKRKSMASLWYFSRRK